MSFISTVRAYIDWISKKNQIIIFWIIIVAVGEYSVSVINNAAVSGTDAYMKVSAQNKAAKREYEKQLAFNKSESSRVRLAENKWNEQNTSQLTVAFVDHSVIKIPVCEKGKGQLPVVTIDSTSFNQSELEVKLSNGYWLFDLFKMSEYGKVYTRQAVKSLITSACQSPKTPVQLNNKIVLLGNGIPPLF